MSKQALSGLGTADEVRKAWHEAHVTPLWDSQLAHRNRPTERANIWKWTVMKPLINAAAKLTSTEVAERRVLSLIDPNPRQPGTPCTITNLNGGLQILMPGESARPHRHSMSALRFVLFGSGAATVVDGKRCPMMEGDLVITPGWTWHEHAHNGQGPVVWLDVLDAALHQYLGTDAFEPGPVHDLVPQTDDALFASCGIVPEIDTAATSYSPVFRFPWAAAAAAVSRAPSGRDGARRVRYVNPMTGGAVMPLLDCYLIEIGAHAQTLPFRSSAHAIYTVVEGSGNSRIGDDMIAWEPKDVFTLPERTWITHRANSESARLFVVSDREVLRRLDLLTEEYRESPG